MIKILIVEDEAPIRMALEDDFLAEGYKVESAENGLVGYKKSIETEYDIIILDVMMPEMDGFEVLREIRKRNISTPVIMLTAKSQEIDKILGLEFGADDYVTKPFSPRELQSRVKAVLRRTASKNQDEVKSDYQFGDVYLDFRKYECLKSGNKIPLTKLEFDLLKYLINNTGEVIDRDRIVQNVWGNDVFVSSRTVDTHILNLRKKIEDNPSEPQWIIGIRGRGYKFLS